MRYLSSISLALVALMALACTATPAIPAPTPLPTPAKPTSDIAATVEAQVHATVTAMHTPVVTETPTATPMPTFTPTIEPTPMFTPTIEPTPTFTPTIEPTPTILPSATPIPATKTPVPTPTPNKGSWRSGSYTDPINDTKITYAKLDASPLSKSIFGDKFELTLRCKDNKIDIYINWESFIDMDSASVTTRLDDKAATTAVWNVSTDYTSTFYPARPGQFLQALINANKLIARVTPYSGSPLTATFYLTGIRVVGTQILAACQG